MTVCDDYDVAGHGSFFEVFPVVFPHLRPSQHTEGDCTMEADLLNHSVDAHTHLLYTFAAGASVLPNLPAWIFGLDLGWEETFVLAVVPLSDFLSDDVVRKLVKMVEKEMESLVCADTWRDVDCTQVGRIEDL